MAPQFCMKCGTPLAADAQFCSKCGAPTGVAAAPPAPDAGGLPPPPPPPPAQPLGQALGVGGVKQFLVQHQFLSGGHSYRILDTAKKHLFTAKENFGQEMQQNFMGGMFSNQGMVGTALMSRTFAWTIHDAAGAVRANVTFQINGYNAQATLTDMGGAPIMVVNVNRGLMGKMTASAVYTDGRPMFQTQGNLIHHNFGILDPTGRELAKIHEAWASVRDTYSLDLTADVDPVGPIIFAILIDREKERN
jgi:uncharacterized protein YxjI